MHHSQREVRDSAARLCMGLAVAISAGGVEAGTVRQPGDSSAGSHNLCVVLTETLANRMLAHRQTDAGDVRDVILGADVYGKQTTASTTTIDFVPCSIGANFYLVTTGATWSETVGVTPWAMIHTCGDHRFRLVKPVYFDGTRFHGGATVASVFPHNRNLAARTPLGSIPLLGSLAERQAHLAADQRKPQAEIEAAAHLSDRVAARFIPLVDARLANAEGKLRRTIRPAQSRLGFVAGDESWATTHDRLSYTARLGLTILEASEPSMQRQLQNGELAAICMHESVLNTLLERQELTGRSFTDSRISEFEARLKQWLNRQEPAPAADGADDAPSQLYTVVFADQEPIAIEVADGAARVVIRAGFQPVLGNPIPVQRITVSIRFTLTSDVLRLEADEIDVVPDDGGEAGMSQQLIRQMIQARLKPVELQRTFSLPNDGNETVRLNIGRVVAEDGWLTITLR